VSLQTLEAAPSELPPTRRSFYIQFIYGAFAAMTAALGIPALIYLFTPPKAQKESEWVEATDIASIPVNTPTEVAFRRNRVDGWKVTSEKTTAWVVKHAADQVVAFTPQCTHLGCAYHWDAQTHTFLCPCHGSVFAMNGDVLAGPAPRPLDRYEVKIEDGKLDIGPVEPHA
jgi:quinol---cytochrome c reductase iron-sulfur subunit, bacillus type